MDDSLTLDNYSPVKVNNSEVLLEVRDLNISFLTGNGELKAVNGVSYEVREGEIMGIVGESGCGKSVSVYAITRLLKPPARVNGGKVLYQGMDIYSLSQKELRAIRGGEIGMIFQNPVSSLDPVFTVGSQMTETIRVRDRTASKAAARGQDKTAPWPDARAQSIEALRSVGIRNPELVFRQYPFELSGGMCQRVMIAIALLREPKLLIADEPTTALDVTVAAGIIQLLRDIRDKNNMAIIYITHNFGVAAELCDRISVMYGGYILERGPARDVLRQASHPYTRALVAAMPRMDTDAKSHLASVRGEAADPLALPDGCVFHPRCPYCDDICRASFPPRTELGDGHSVSCWLHAESRSVLTNLYEKGAREGAAEDA